MLRCQCTNEAITIKTRQITLHEPSAHTDNHVLQEITLTFISLIFASTTYKPHKVGRTEVVFGLRSKFIS